ncbi:oligosaccharyl transferase subunit OST3/OST6 family [Gautieria morchelliformis]|nr:oligosaccharyl transferase subunit OST3/OST6 family [Gautieria morchelliformis]
MLLLPLLSLLSLSCLAAAKQSPRERFTALAAANDGIVKLDDELYNLLTSPSRDWSAAIQLTALKSFKCPPCKELEPAFKALGKAWSQVSATDRDDHFFATLDFEDGKETFKKLGLSSAPVLRVHPPAQGPRQPPSGRSDPLTYDFGNSGFDPALLAEHLSRYTPVPIPYKAPPNYALIATTATSILTLVVVARFILPILMSRWTWAVFTIGMSLTMVGGFMFVHIRGMPYIAGGQHGGVEYIAPGFQTQYGIEVQIIGFLYGVLSLGFISMTMIIPRHTSPARQRYGVYVWTGVSLTLFSVLVSIFKIKNGGYPFRLFL